MWHSKTFSTGRMAGLGMLLLTLFAFAAAAPARAASDPQDGVAVDRPRVAFVIGSNEYENIPKLKNPVNDAKAVAASLRRLNFQVVEGYDITLAQFNALFVDNQALIESAEAVVFYYAGHAFQIDGQNYLVPVDAQLRSVMEIDTWTVRLNTVIRQLQDPDRPSLIFLDACRNNPLPESVKLENRQDGLAQIEAGLNTFVAFATQPGNVSNDGFGNNSPFATALVKNLETPGLSISDLVIEVRNETRAMTLEQQSPWDQSSLLAQFYFTERQRINPEKLLAAFAAINGDDRLRTVYEADLEGNYSFQAAIFRTAYRAVEVLEDKPDAVPGALTELITEPAAPPERNPTEFSGEVEVASVSPSLTIEGDEAFTMLGSLEFSGPGEAAPADAANEKARQRTLARLMQTELRRLGCYRMAIDGLWGPGSRRAFTEFLQNTGQSADSVEPSAGWLNRLVLHSGRVCRAPVKYTPPAVEKKVIARRPSPRTTTVRRQPAKSVPAFRQRAVRGQSRQAKRERRTQRQNALPPDISMGVGIGM